MSVSNTSLECRKSSHHEGNDGNAARGRGLLFRALIEEREVVCVQQEDQHDEELQ